MLKLKELKEKWSAENALYGSIEDEESLLLFQKKNKVILPPDLMEYFKSLNGTGGEYTNDLFDFYSVDRIQRVKDELKNYKASPDYSSLLNINEISGLYVFADSTFHLFVYAIRLYPELSMENEVYILCGDRYKKIVNSFSEFIELYLKDSRELYFVEPTYGI